MNLELNPGANIDEQNLGSYKASRKKLQHREIANQQALGNQQENEEDNTNQRVLLTSVQTQSPTKQGRKEQRRKREPRWKPLSQDLFSYLQPSSLESWYAIENSKTKNISTSTRRMLSTRRRQEIRITRSPCVQTKLKENIKLLKNKSTHGRQYTTRTSKEKNKRDPCLDEYYDIVEKDKDRDKDEESTYAQTKTSSPISRPEQQRSYSENWSERSLPQDWEDDRSDSEDSCDVRIDGEILYIVVYYMFLILQSYLWWFFTSFINNCE